MTEKKKRFRWWFIPLGLVLLVVLAAGALVLYLHSLLPWPNLVAITSNFQL